MVHSEQINLATKYVVDDLPGAKLIGARLNSILVKIDTGGPVSQLARNYLLASGLCSLHALIEGQTDLETFKRDATAERALRMESAQIAAREQAADEEKLMAERAAASAAIFSDPAFRRRQEAKQLRRKFKHSYVEPEHYPRVMKLLNLVSQGQRLRPEDVAWLQTIPKDCWTDEVATAWHLIEAEALTTTWEKTGDPWAAVNASKHWRKGSRSGMSLKVTEQALASAAASAPKVRSALSTTRGGAMRDLSRLGEAKVLGEQAHSLSPNDYRPCTLLGAVHIELGNLAVGHEWFVKAEQLGADQASIDQDIRVLLARASQPEKERIRVFLLERDAKRFNWLRDRKGTVHKSAPLR